MNNKEYCSEWGIPVNKSNEEEGDNNCHRSLLVFNVRQNVSYHFDTCYKLNSHIAKQMIERLSRFVKLGSAEINNIEVDCLKQHVSIECGVYYLHFAKIICDRMSRNWSYGMAWSTDGTSKWIKFIMKLNVSNITNWNFQWPPECTAKQHGILKCKFE